MFRGCIYRHLVTYKPIQPRQNYQATDKMFIDYIENNLDNKTNLDIKEIIKIGLSKTSNQLTFSSSKNDKDPNKLIYSNTAHCVGYASFFATTCNHLIQQNNLSNSWIAEPQIGKMFLLGINVHKFFNSSFFKDHDFVIIKNLKTGKVYAVDPTVNDYLYIDYITFNH